jgi:GAF domain-containing protein
MNASRYHDRLRTLARLAELVSSELDIDKILGQIASSAAQLIECKVVSLWVADEATETLELRAFSNDTIGASHASRRLAFGEGGAGWVARHRQTLEIEDVLADSRIRGREWFVEHGLRSALSVPITYQDSLLGVLALLGEQPFALTPEDRDLLNTFVAQAAGAIRNVRLFAESEKRRRAAEALAQLSRVCSETLDLDTVARRVVQSVHTLLGIQEAALYRLVPETGDLIPLGFTGEGAQMLGTSAVFPRGTGVVGLAVEQRRTVFVANILTDPRVTQAPAIRERLERVTYRAVLALPLLVKDRVIGALAVCAPEDRVFGEDEVALAQAFADQSALVLENAQLFEDTERRRREAESLSEISTQITASLDLGMILSRVGEAAQELCGADMSGIALRDLDTGTTRIRHWRGTHGQYNGAELRPGQGIGGQVLLEGKPFRTNDYVADSRISPLRLAADAEGIVTALAVPVRTEDAIEGVLYVANRTPKPFTDHDEARLTRLAQHAAIAIKNAQLLGALRAHQARLEALLEVSHELSRIQPVQSLLEAIGRACGEVLDAESVGFRLLEGDELVAAGLWGDAKETMPTERIRVGESLSGTVAASGVPLRLHDMTGDSRLLPSHREATMRLGYRAFLGVPVKVGDRLIGVLSIRTRRPRGFSKEDEAIATAFASQAATAIENSRLFQQVQLSAEEVSRAKEALLQAQKMDAIGRLAGGVAHDFNNLLTVIHGRTEILLKRLQLDTRSHQDLELVQRTAQRAADLTHQLLAFSRKQVLQPKILGLNEVVANLSTMLRRLIGEDIDLVIVPDAGLDRVKADPTQLEQVLMNLAVNARDAMPRGGRLSIETACIELGAAFVREHPGARPGPHVRVSVADEGVGMTSEVKSRIFEPFFTTKDKGRGTGLGLSTVYGIVKQHDGYIDVRSAPGEGTAFDLYLPAAETGEGTVETESVGVRAPRGSETILLVEDEDDVRELAREILEMNGYTVLEAPHGPEALRVCRHHRGAIQLLLTDVVMPQMSGRELAARITETRPETRVTYMSGYTDDFLGHHGVLDPGIVLLSKPFTPDALLNGVRRALDAPGGVR